MTEELLHAYSIMRNISDMILYYFDRHSLSNILHHVSKEHCFHLAGGVTILKIK